MKRHVLPIVLLLIFSFWSIRSLTASGFFPMHDDTQVGRVVAMGRALRNGQFPVRWVSDLGYGYGYPVFNFYGPLPYYVGGFLYMLGVSGIVATKIIFIAGTLLAGVTLYALMGTSIAPAAGVLAGVLIIYAPYHAVQVYVRGAMGELWALAFLPLVVLGLLKKRSILGGIGLAGVILSHTIVGYITVVWYIVGLFFYAIYLLCKKQFHFSFFTSPVSLLIIGLSLSAFFWLPASLEMRWTSVAGQIGPTANYLDHFVCLPQLWSSLWGFGGSVPGCIDGMSFKLGKLHIVLGLVGVLIGIWRRSISMKLVIVGLSSTLTATFLLLPESALVWRILPFSSYVQYPWRFLTFATVGIAVLGGVVICMTKRKLFGWVTAVFLCVVVVYVNAKWFMPQFTYERPAEAFETDEELRFRVSKISDEYLPPEINRPATASDIAVGDIIPGRDYTVETEVDTETYGRFTVHSATDVFIRIQRAYFPGWVYLVNGKRIMPKVVAGLPELPVPYGNSVVEIHFYNTPVRSIGNLISAFMVVVLIVYGKRKTKAIA